MSGSQARTVAAHRDLVAGLFPQLALDEFEPIAGGWTCDTYRVDREWIVQLPRTSYARERLLRQIEVLPELSGEVSASVPMPELVSREPVCMAYRALPGDPCDTVGDEGLWPERLGRFLYDLHMVPPEFLGMRSATADTVREGVRAEWARLRDLAAGHLQADELDAASTAIDAVLDDDAAWRFAPCVTHGDLGPEHVLVSTSGDLSGVLDWEDVGIGDPAWDFAWWVHEMPDVGERALAAYGGAPDPGFTTRARLSFVLMPLHDLDHGLQVARPEHVDAGLAGFRARLAVLGRQGRPAS